MFNLYEKIFFSYINIIINKKKREEKFIVVVEL